MNSRTEAWGDLERLLAQLLSSLSIYLDADTLDIVSDLIDNREFGVAADWFLSVVAERSLPLSESDKGVLTKVLGLMGETYEPNSN